MSAKQRICVNVLIIIATMVIQSGTVPVLADDGMRPSTISWSDIESMLRSIAIGAALIGVLLFGLTLILPGDMLSIVGLQIPQNYLQRLAFGALVIGGASAIVSFLFD